MNANASVRHGLASFDTVLGTVRANYRHASTLVVSWDRTFGSVAVMGLLDQSGGLLDVGRQSLGALSAMLQRPMPSDVLRLAFPESGVHRASSGAVALNIPVDEPVWARVLDYVSGLVDAGFRVAPADVRIATWLVLEAAGLPSGSVSARRTVMFTDVPDEPMFEPVAFHEFASGEGRSVSWAEACRVLPMPIHERRLVSLVGELAVLEERKHPGALLTDVLVSL